jgi:hypothetical protein
VVPLKTGESSIVLRQQARLTGQGRAMLHLADESYSRLLEYAPLFEPKSARLERRTDKHSGDIPQALLEDLNEHYGLPWSAIASLLEISVIALNKWREGGGVSDARYLGLRRLTAFCELAEEDGIGAIRSWFGSKPVGRAPFTRTDLYRAGAGEALLESHLREEQGECLLDCWIPRWREAVSLLHPVESVDQDGTFLIDLPELGLVAVGHDRDSAREDLLEQVREYVADWDRISDAPNHASNRSIIATIRPADDDELRRLLFG